MVDAIEKQKRGGREPAPTPKPAPSATGPRVLYLDLESYCEVPISHGTYKYASAAEVTVLAYALNDGPVQVVDMTVAGAKEEWRDNLRDTLEHPDTIAVIHNSMFDRNVLKYSLGVNLKPEQIHDTMIIAAMHSLPMGLDALCQVFGLPPEMAKDKDGKRLIKMFCIPQPKTKKRDAYRIMPTDEPEEWAKFLKYAGSDIIAMREIYKKMPKWNFKLEHPTWCLDQKINDRGFKVDVKLAEAAIRAVEKAQAQLALQADTLSDGLVASATQRDALLSHLLLEHGVALPDMTKSTLERRVNDPELSYAVRQLLAIRLDAATTSTSKYEALLEGVNNDARMRGTLQAYGAGRTGRWAGRKFQPQNLPRPAHSWEDILFAIDALMNDVLHLLTNDVMKLTSSVIRSVIIPEEGKELAVADLSNIEGRVAAWLAGEEWKVKAFADFDAGTGFDLYALAYAKSFGVHPNVVMDNKKTGDGSFRQIGKVQELALGYGGGVGAFVSMAANYNIDLEDMAVKALPNIPQKTLDSATNFWNKTERKYGLSERVFVVCDSIKRLYRESQKEIASYWFELEDTARQAIENPNVEFECRKVTFIRKKSWLLIKLPSGRCLCYPDIRVDDEGVISYMGMDSYTKQWKRLKTYGGKLFENICQAVARDVLAANMPLVESKGFEIVLTVHDELITETSMELDEVPTCFWKSKSPIGEYLGSLMATNPSWAIGLPLAAGGFTANRYRKD